MTRAMIVGAGQSGLCLANGMLDQGFDVTLMTGKSSVEMRNDRPALVQFTPPNALAIESELGLDQWSDLAPPVYGLRTSLYPEQTIVPSVVDGRFKSAGISVDPRMKMAEWLERFEDRGGRVVIHGVTVSDLDYFTRMYDLIVIAVGDGELGEIFDNDPTRFSGAHPRVITQSIVHGYEERGEFPGRIECISSPEGRILVVPTLTAHGPAHSICVIGDPGGAMDGTHLLNKGGKNVRSAKEVTDWIVQSMATRFPDYRDSVASVQPVDGSAAMVRKIRPQVRSPVGVLPSGGIVMGSADAVVTTDPISGQGWNISTNCAYTYLNHMRSNTEDAFTGKWIRNTFDSFYEGMGKYSAQLSEMVHHLWDYEMPEYFQSVVATAQYSQEVSDRFAHGIDEPKDYQEWFFDEESAHKYLAQVVGNK